MKVLRGGGIYLFIVLTAVNVFLLMSFYKERKVSKNQIELPQSLSPATPRAVDLTYYNSLCPEIEMIATDGKIISLRDYLGHVIILKFIYQYHTVLNVQKVIESNPLKKLLKDEILKKNKQ